MVYVSLPLGGAHGWGVAGGYIARRLADLGPLTLVVPPAWLAALDPIEARALSPLVAGRELWSVVEQARTSGGVYRLDGPLLTSIVGADMQPWMPHLRGKRTVGYVFFEQAELEPQALENARTKYDVVATGSRWCADVLERHGFSGAVPILQGVDLTLFRPPPDDRPREFMRKDFVIFVGGKLELRKGQDLAIRAVSEFMRRHDDAVLLNAWFNGWPDTIAPLRHSPHARCTPPPAGTSGMEFARTYPQWNAQFLLDNGIAPSRAVSLPSRPNAMMPWVYHQSDVGIFANRCEGGTNLVMMEYLACGKPAIAARATGQAEVLTHDNCIPLTPGALSALPPGMPRWHSWPEVSVDEIVDRLEWAYAHRDELEEIGRRGAQSMMEFTWHRTAQKLMQALTAT